MERRKDTTCIRVHHSLSKDVSVDEIRRWHLARPKPFADIGYHFVIRFSGAIEMGRSLELIGAHAEGKNGDSIGVCVVGDFSKTTPSEAQYINLLQLQKSLSFIYGKHLPIKYHHETCPGEKFDREYLGEVENYRRSMRSDK